MNGTRERYDVAVIGSGIAGLTAASFLAREGRSVIVLEQGLGPGGCVGGFERGGFLFDGGAQSFESLGQLFPLMDELGVLGELAPERVTYRLRSPSVDCSLSAGYESIADAFCAGHPEAEAALRRFFGELFRVSRAIERVADPERSPWIEPGLARLKAVARLLLGQPGSVARMISSRRVPLRKAADQLLGEGGLGSMLGTFLYRDSTLFEMGAFFYSWRNDYWRPQRGVQDLTRLLIKSLGQGGGIVRCQAPVDQVLRLGSRVIGVRLSSGEEVLAPAVVAACDRAHLWRDLMGLPVSQPSPEDVSDAFFTLFLGLDLPDRALDALLPEHHTFLVPEYRDCRLDPGDSAGHRGRWLEVSRGSLPGPGLAPDGCSSLIVQTMSRADWANWWGLEPDGHRNGRYRELKEQVEEELLDTLEQFVPGLRSHVRLRFSATPWTYQRYTRNSHGASAGWSYDKARSRAWHSANQDEALPGPDGLFQCGHWTNGMGSVPGAALSGWSAARQVLASRRS